MSSYIILAVRYKVDSVASPTLRPLAANKARYALGVDVVNTLGTHVMINVLP